MTDLEILRRSFRPIDATDPTPLGCRCSSPTRAPGVYLLIEDNRIVYVGFSRDVWQRLRHHIVKRDSLVLPEEYRRPDAFAFDCSAWMPVPLRVVREYEAALICYLRPIHNKSIPRGQHDAEILFGLGLRDSIGEDDIEWEDVA